MKTFAECLSLVTFNVDQTMRNVILIEEIVQFVSKWFITPRHNPHSCEIAVPFNPAPPHDQRIDNRFAYRGDFSQSAPQLDCWNVKDLGVWGCHPRRCERRRSL